MQANPSSQPRVEQVILHPDPILSAEHLSITIGQRFWSHVTKTGTCWLWAGYTCGSGGRIGRGGQAAGEISVARLSWLIHFGAVPEGKRVSANCGNPLCVRPDHLKLGYSPPPPPHDPTGERALALAAIDALDFAHGYSRQDPTLPAGFSTSFRDRFWAKVNKTESCWLWTGAVGKGGYGWIGKGWNQKPLTIAAHVASWILHHGAIPDGLRVMHNCPDGTRGNPGCVNPAHLMLGTAKDNSVDAITKDKAAGKLHWNSRKLTKDMVAAIRAKFAAGGISKQAIADEFGVDRTHVSRIVNGIRHVRF